MAGPVLGIVGAAIGGAFGGPMGAQIGFAVGSAIGGLIDPPQFDGPKLGDAPIQTSRDGIPIPIGWGIFHVHGNLMAMNPFVDIPVKSGGKKTGTVAEERRTRTFAIGIGRGRTGPIDGILRVWENNKLVYDARPAATLPAADSAAFLTEVTIYLGDEAQLPDPELESNFGVGTTPSYRGLPYIVFNNKDITDFGSSIPSYRFEVWSTGFRPFATQGTTATQDGWNGQTSHTHPFDGQTFTEFTYSCMFKVEQVPTFLDNNRYVFNTGAMFVKMFWSQSSSAVRIQADIPSGSEFVVLGKSTGHSGDLSLWKYDDWYIVTVSISETTPKILQFLFSNVTRGDEVYFESTAFTCVPLDFTGLQGSESSQFTYGALSWSTAPDPDDITNFLMGKQAFLYMNEGYVDLDLPAVRNLFRDLNGRISFGADGELPMSGQPLIYLIDGHPHINKGTADIGTWKTDFYYQNETYKLEFDTEEYPVANVAVADITEDTWPKVGSVQTDLAVFSDVDEIDATEINDIPMRGFMAAGMYSAADTSRVLQRAYFYDLPEIDGNLVAILRGGASVVTINRTDMVIGQEAIFETAREQG